MPRYEKIKRTSTIQELINVGKRMYYTPDKLNLKETIKKSDGTIVVFNIYSIIDRYIDDLESFVRTIELNDQEYLKYMYQPKRLCVDVYNCIDMAPLILKLNNMISLLEFNKKSIKLYSPNIMKILNEIMILESEQFNLNESEVNKKINGTK